MLKKDRISFLLYQVSENFICVEEDTELGYYKIKSLFLLNIYEHIT